MSANDRDLEEATKQLQRNRKQSSWHDLLDFVDVPDLEGLLFLLGALLAFLLGWAAVDLLFPFVVLGVYLLLVSALGRVANDRHDCEGHLGRALGWGALWATIYTLPLALLVWALHVLVARAAPGSW